MKVVVAIDSLKGSLSSMEAGRAIREGVLKVIPEAEVLVKPLADGGEGTTEAPEFEKVLQKIDTYYFPYHYTFFLAVTLTHSP